MTRRFWRAAVSASAAVLLAVPVLEPAFVRAGHLWWAWPGIGRFHRAVVHRLCERLRASDRGLRTVVAEGVRLTLDVTQFTVGPLYFGGRTYEAETARCLREHLRQGGVFVDVGANAGYFTLLAASRVGPAGHVFAFEPNPAVLATLRDAVRRNGFEARVAASPLALSDRAEARTPLFVSQSATNSGLSSLAPSAAVLANGDVSLDRFVEVATGTFDGWWRAAGRPRVDLVKIDVENLEDRVVAGMAAALSAGAIGAVICETSPGGAADARLRQHGFASSLLESYGAVANVLYRSAAAS